MAVEQMQDQLLDEIKVILERDAQIVTLSMEPITRGHLNEKWCLETNKGKWFVKSYSPERYRKHFPGIWLEIEKALALQVKYNLSDGKCPEVLAIDGRYMHTTASGRKFVVMEFCTGDVIRAGEVSENRMYSLGKAAAAMHKSWNQSKPESNQQSAAPTEEPRWGFSHQEMIFAWEERWGKVKHQVSDKVRYALQLQKEIVDSLTGSDFSNITPGWTHLDLWVDNLLFHQEELSAIVDFDRVRYAYPILDLGRAVLSCILNEGTFRKEAAVAFAEGYRSSGVLARGELLRAVRYTWAIESFWWIRPTLETFSPAPDRFAKEMIWTAAEWDRLQTTLGDI